MMNCFVHEKDESTEDRIIKDTRNFFRLKKGNKPTKDYIYEKDNLRENVFEQEEDCYNSVRVGNFWSNNLLQLSKSR